MKTVKLKSIHIEPTLDVVFYSKYRIDRFDKLATFLNMERKIKQLLNPMMEILCNEINENRQKQNQ